MISVTEVMLLVVVVVVVVVAVVVIEINKLITTALTIITLIMSKRPSSHSTLHSILKHYNYSKTTRASFGEKTSHLYAAYFSI